MKSVKTISFISIGSFLTFGYSCKEKSEPSTFYYRFEEKVRAGDTLEYGLDVGYPVLAACEENLAIVATRLEPSAGRGYEYLITTDPISP